MRGNARVGGGVPLSNVNAVEDAIQMVGPEDESRDSVTTPTTTATTTTTILLLLLLLLLLIIIRMPSRW